MRITALPSESSKTSNAAGAFAVCLTVVLLFWPSIQTAMALAVRDDRYLHVLLAPLACAFLMFWNRSAIFAEARYSPNAGIPLLLCATVLALACAGASLALSVSAAVLVCFAGFVLCYGVRSFRAGLYPLCCLLLTIPPPALWMERVAAWLQRGSADVAYFIFRLTPFPVLRHGIDFSLAGLNFEIGPECSGIHSTLALMMVAIGAAYVYLRTGWARTVLLLLIVPIVLVKNALRIVVISTLGAYVNRVFVDGAFHHRFGGLVFSAVGVVLLFAVLLGLQKVERRARHIA